MSTKRAVFEAMLTQEPIVNLFIDGRKDGVKVPQKHAVKALRLHYGLNLPRPIVDLKVDDEGVSAVLLFDGTPTETFIPWTAVYAIVNQAGKGLVSAADIPPDLDTPEGLASVPEDNFGPVEPSPAPTPWTPRLIRGGAYGSN